MSEKKEITALVHLLEDPDEKIYIQIKEKLMEIGPFLLAMHYKTESCIIGD